MTYQKIEKEFMEIIHQIPEDYWQEILTINREIANKIQARKTKSIIGSWAENSDIVDAVIEDIYQSRNLLKLREARSE